MYKIKIKFWRQKWYFVGPNISETLFFEAFWAFLAPKSTFFDQNIQKRKVLKQFDFRDTFFQTGRQFFWLEIHEMFVYVQCSNKAI